MLGSSLLRGFNEPALVKLEQRLLSLELPLSIGL